MNINLIDEIWGVAFTIVLAALIWGQIKNKN